MGLGRGHPKGWTTSLVELLRDLCRAGKVTVVNFEHQGGEAGVVDLTGRVAIAGRIGPVAFGGLVDEQLVANLGVVSFPFFAAVIDHRL